MPSLNQCQPRIIAGKYDITRFEIDNSSNPTSIQLLQADSNRVNILIAWQVLVNGWFAFNQLGNNEVGDFQWTNLGEPLLLEFDRHGPIICRELWFSPQAATWLGWVVLNTTSQRRG